MTTWRYASLAIEGLFGDHRTILTRELAPLLAKTPTPPVPRVLRESDDERPAALRRRPHESVLVLQQELFDAGRQSVNELAQAERDDASHGVDQDVVEFTRTLVEETTLRTELRVLATAAACVVFADIATNIPLACLLSGTEFATLHRSPWLLISTTILAAVVFSVLGLVPAHAALGSRLPAGVDT